MTINHLCVDEVEIAYTDEGTGHPIVFVHGVCIVPTWPFGAHEMPTPKEADLGVLAAWRRIGKFLEALDLSNVTLVVNDTGRGIVQAALADPDGYSSSGIRDREYARPSRNGRRRRVTKRRLRTPARARRPEF
jgi:pimeloyl-ACP methyl ester carboxylesterase